MKYRHFLFAAAVVLAPAIEFEPDAPAGLMSSAAYAQQISNQPWSFTPRSRSMAAQFDFQRKMENGSASDGMAALQQFVTQYNSSSTSVGNLNQVTQILSGGASGAVDQSTAQTASGNQGSTATTDTTVHNTANTTTGAQGIAASGGTNGTGSNNNQEPAIGQSASSAAAQSTAQSQAQQSPH